MSTPSSPSHDEPSPPVDDEPAATLITNSTNSVPEVTSTDTATTTTTRKRDAPPSPPEPNDRSLCRRRSRGGSAENEVVAAEQGVAIDDDDDGPVTTQTTSHQQLAKKIKLMDDNDRNREIKETTAPSPPPPTVKEPPTTTHLLPMNNNNNNDPSESSSSNKSRKKQKRTKRKHLDPALATLRTTVQQCCKRNDLATALEVYEAAVEAQTPLDRITFDCLLNLCDGSLLVNSSRYYNNNNNNPPTIHVGTPRSNNSSNRTSSSTDPNETTISPPPPPPTIRAVDDETRYQYANRLWRHLEEQTTSLAGGQSQPPPLSETAYLAMIRLTSRTRRFDEAVPWLERAERDAATNQSSSPRLRLYTPLLTAYCREHEHVQNDDDNDDNNNNCNHCYYLLQAVQLWHRLSQKYQLQLTEKEYSTLLRSCVRGGATAAAAIVVERVLTDVSEIVPVPALITIQTLKAWFESQHARQVSENTPNNETIDTIRQLLHEIPSPYRPETPILGSVVHIHGWIVSEACRVETSTGRLLSGCWQDHELQPVTLRPEAWQDMQRLNENLVLTGQATHTDTRTVQGGRKGRKRPISNPQERQRHWQAFLQYLEQRRKRHQQQQQQQPKNDGKSSVDVVVDGANVGYYQTNFAGAPKHVDFRQIDQLLQHLIHTNPSCSVLLVMHSRHFDRRQMPQWAHPIVQKWIARDWLYRTPPGMNDDWFWLHAALAEQAMVVTNDEMRDHHFQMVAPQSFLRWRDRYQIHFTFGSQRQVQLIHPERYSRRIQKMGNDEGFVVPLPKRGDENRFLDGAFVAGENEEVPEEETYLCIRKKEAADE